MLSMNKAILIGRLARDPEVRYTQQGTAIAQFTLAVNRRVKKDSKQQTADFIPVVAWGKLAELVGKHLSKGKRIGIEGRIQVRNYDAKDGTKRYVTEIMMDEMEFLDSKGNGQQNTPPPLDDEEVPF